MPASSHRRQPWLFRYLRAEDCFGEILFGLIMVLTITLGASVAGRTEDAGKPLLLAALGCNLAWAIIDAVMYLLARLMEHGRSARLLHDVQRAPNREGAVALIAASLDPILEPLAAAEVRRSLYEHVLDRLRQAPPPLTSLRREDFHAAGLSGLLVMASALPAALPFMLIDDQHLALRISNGLLIGMLFGVGFFFGRDIHTGALRTGLLLGFLGLGMVAIAIALGG